MRLGRKQLEVLWFVAAVEASHEPGWGPIGVPWSYRLRKHGDACRTIEISDPTMSGPEAYRVAERLVERGLLRLQGETPSETVFQLTEAGRRELARRTS